MARDSFRAWKSAWVVLMLLACSAGAMGQGERSKKVYMITDMEGVDGIFDSDLQCLPWQSPRWQESQKLLTEEVNAG